MIRVTIEVLPGGDASKSKKLRILEIANVFASEYPNGESHYEVTMHQDGAWPVKWSVTHRPADGVESLVCEALRAVGR